MGGMPDDIRDVSISSEVIRLGQLLKFAGIAESGAAAAAIISAGDVRVNDASETRRGRQLGPGDVVDVDAPGGKVRLRLIAEETEG